MKYHFWMVLPIIFSLLVWQSPGSTRSSQAAAAERHVCSSGCAYTTIQAAVDAASAGDVIKVAAGTYSGVTLRSGLNQVVYINKAVTLMGGFTSANWSTYNPAVNLTTLDAKGSGRVLYITLRDQAAAISGLRLVNGDAAKSGDGSATLMGGGVYLLGGETSSTVTLSDNLISTNTTPGEGAGLAAVGVSLTLTGNTISNNAIKNANGMSAAGGGVALKKVTAQLKTNTFFSNRVPLNDSAGDAGGGLYASDSTVTLTGNTFESNTAEQGGGLSGSGSSLTLSGNLFKTNTAIAGGGVYFDSNSGSSNSLNLTANTFLQNSASASGGGAYLTPYQVTVMNNLFEENSVTGASDTGCQGGGLLAAGMSQVVIDRNRVIRNTAHSDGGGLCLESTPLVTGNLVSGNTARAGGAIAISGYGDAAGDNPSVINNVLIGNQAAVEGSAVVINGSSATLIHNTLNRNTGGEASIYLAPNLSGDFGTLTLTNSVFANQKTGIIVTDGYSAVIDGILWFNVTTTVKSDEDDSIQIQHGYTGNPLFEVDGYHLLAGSAAIDRGVSTAVATDIDGQARLNGAHPDLGVDEWYPNRTLIFLPDVSR